MLSRALLIFLLFSTHVMAAASSSPVDGSDETGGQFARLDDQAMSLQELDSPSGKLLYRATAGAMPLKDEQGKTKAKVFFVAYEKLAANEPAATQPSQISATRPAGEVTARPITFVFNGGPGAAAVWLHLGAVGPQRIDLDEVGNPPSPPHRLVNNAYTWLEATDLVFIDPVGTGFSRPVEGEKREQFYGVQEDIAWVADFIRLYVTQYQRWLSPKFIAGESYGTTRAGGLSEYLLDRYGIALNGVIMVSSVLDFQTIMPGDNNDLPYALYLPAYTAVAWYQKKLPAELQKDLKDTLAQSERWMRDVYIGLLAKGRSLSTGEQEQATAQLSRFTGLPASLIQRHNLRIGPGVFQKQLLAEARLLVGRFDGRMVGFDPKPASSWPAYDPSLSGYFAAYSSTFNHYVRWVLGYESALPYEVLTDKVQPWKYGDVGQGYLSVTDELRSALIKNPHLKVHFASGYYDLATPFAATVYTVDHLDIEPRLRANISLSFYESGHMMYHHRPSLIHLHEQIARFIRSACDASRR